MHPSPLYIVDEVSNAFQKAATTFSPIPLSTSSRLVSSRILSVNLGRAKLHSIIRAFLSTHLEHFLTDKATLIRFQGLLGAREFRLPRSYTVNFVTEERDLQRALAINL